MSFSMARSRAGAAALALKTPESHLLLSRRPHGRLGVLKLTVAMAPRAPRKSATEGNTYVRVSAKVALFTTQRCAHGVVSALEMSKLHSLLSGHCLSLIHI